MKKQFLRPASIQDPNSLNTLRLLGAIQVMYGHMMVHLQLPQARNVLWDILAAFRGVPVFFLLSGFLIWNSLEREHSYPVYLKKRFFRMYPELWCSIVLELVTIALLYPDVVWGDLVKLALLQGTVFQFKGVSSLGGYGCGAPNGALWTISVLIQFYLVVLLLYRLLHGRRLWCWLAALAASIGLSFALAPLQEVLTPILYACVRNSLLPYLWVFLLGCMLAEYARQLLPLLKWCWLPMLLLWVLCRRYGITCVVGDSYDLVMVGLCVVAWIGLAYAAPWLNIKTDVTYGLYLYHMIVVNAMIELGMVGQPWHMVLAYALSFALAWLSTVTVGRWSGKLKRRLA